MSLHRIIFTLPVVLFFGLLLSACQPAQAGLPTPQPASADHLLPSPSLPAGALSATEPLPAATNTALPATATASPVPSPTLSPTATQPPITTLLFTGIIVPARCVQAAIDETGNPDHPYEEIAPVIQAADFAVGVLNATMSDQVIHTGCVRTYQLVGSPQNADAAARAGFDMMSVATNHIKDCGMMKGWCDETFFDTLFHLKRVGILTVGAGANEDEALQPVVVTLNGVRFGFVALGDSKLTETVFATATNPGIAYLIEENIRRAAQAARQVSDVVIFMPHWGSEDMLLPNWIQRGQARIIASTGVDLVIGTHPHVVQPMQWIDGIPVFYSLGNFIFDQELNINQQGIIVVVRFQGAQFLDYEILPTLVEHDGRVRLADEANTAEILERFEQGSAQLK